MSLPPSPRGQVVPCVLVAGDGPAPDYHPPTLFGMEGDDGVTSPSNPLASGAPTASPAATALASLGSYVAQLERRVARLTAANAALADRCASMEARSTGRTGGVINMGADGGGQMGRGVTSTSGLCAAGKDGGSVEAVEAARLAAEEVADRSGRSSFAATSTASTAHRDSMDGGTTGGEDGEGEYASSDRSDWDGVGRSVSDATAISRVYSPPTSPGGAGGGGGDASSVVSHASTGANRGEGEGAGAAGWVRGQAGAGAVATPITPPPLHLSNPSPAAPHAGAPITSGMGEPDRVWRRSVWGTSSAPPTPTSRSASRATATSTDAMPSRSSSRAASVTGGSDTPAAPAVGWGFSLPLAALSRSLPSIPGAAAVTNMNVMGWVPSVSNWLPGAGGGGVVGASAGGGGGVDVGGATGVGEVVDDVPTQAAAAAPTTYADLWNALATATGNVASGLTGGRGASTSVPPSSAMGDGTAVPVSSLVELSARVPHTPPPSVVDAITSVLAAISPPAAAAEAEAMGADEVATTPAGVGTLVSPSPPAPSPPPHMDWWQVHGTLVRAASMAKAAAEAHDMCTPSPAPVVGGGGEHTTADADSGVDDGEEGAVAVALTTARGGAPPKPPTHAMGSLPRPLLPSPQPRPRGLRILCLDGGGIRGLLIVEALKRLEKGTGRRIVDSFDLICGTSTGGVVAAALCCGKTLPQIEMQYENIRQAFVTASPIVSEVRRFAMGASHSRETAEAVLREFYGPTRMNELPCTPKCFVLCASSSVSPPQPYLFRSYDLPRAAASRAEIMGASGVAVAEAVRATTSAPTYYEAAMIGRSPFVDGAILQNNPALVAITEAGHLWPGVPIDALVSIGTGTLLPKPYRPAGVMAWVRIMLDLAMSSDLTHRFAAMLLGDAYHRLDMDGGADIIDLAETRLEVIARLVAEGNRYYDRQAAVFDRIIAALEPVAPGGGCMPPLADAAPGVEGAGIATGVDGERLDAAPPTHGIGVGPDGVSMANVPVTDTACAVMDAATDATHV